MSLSQQQLESMLWGAAEFLRGAKSTRPTTNSISSRCFSIKDYLMFTRMSMRKPLPFQRGTKSSLHYLSSIVLSFPNPPAGTRFVKPRPISVFLFKKRFGPLRKSNQRLYGVFGDAQWTNKERLPDHLLSSLVEHFSKIPLGISAVTQDDLGAAYEYLIKKFADDSGHTAAEFYTNRTVVHLMTRVMELAPGESAYDPTCGTGGMLLNAVMDLRKHGKEWRTVKLFGQESEPVDQRHRQNEYVPS